jgi:Mn2+/Fe2+ NRAMP family transporter
MSRRWAGLGLPLAEARGFYSIVAAATVIGVSIDLAGVDSIKALIVAAILNGIVSVPIMVILMLLATNRAVMGGFVAKGRRFVLL